MWRDQDLMICVRVRDDQPVDRELVTDQQKARLSDIKRSIRVDLRFFRPDECSPYRLTYAQLELAQPKPKPI